MKKLPFLLLLFVLTTGFSQSEYYIKSNDGTRLCIHEYGNGKPIIILAGGPGLNATYMHGVWDSLSLFYRCIVPDERGTGKSVMNKIDSSSMSMDRYMDDLETLRKHLNLEQIIIIGHSWGGMLSMEYASRVPNRIKHLILLDPGGPTMLFTSYFHDNIVMRLHDDDLKEIHVLDSLHKPTLSALLPGYFYNRQKGLEFKNVMMNINLFGQAGVSENTVKNYVKDQSHRIAALSKYKNPVDIIQGRQDPIGESTTYEIKKYLPQTNIHFIEGSGHFPWLENSAQVHQFFTLLKKILN